MGIFSRLGKRKAAGPRAKRPSGLRGTGSRRPAVSADEVEEFVFGGQPLSVTSSNVGLLAQYFLDDQQLMLEFHGGRGEDRAYLYSEVSVEEALSFAQAPSKGEWVWDHLRVRGTADQHQKPFTRLR